MTTMSSPRRRGWWAWLAVLGAGFLCPLGEAATLQQDESVQPQEEVPVETPAAASEPSLLTDDAKLRDEAAVTERIGELKKELEGLSADEPNRDTLQRLINNETSALQDWLDLRRKQSTQARLTPSLSNEAIEVETTARDEAQHRLDRLDVDAELGEIRSAPNLDELRSRVERDATLPAEAAFAERTRLATELDVARSELRALPTEISKTRDALSAAITELAPLQQQLDAGPSPADALLLRRRIEVRNTRIAHLRAKTDFLAQRQPPLEAFIRLRTTQLERVDAELAVRQRVRDAAQQLLQQRIAAAQKDADQDLARKRKELAQATSDFDRLLKEEQVRSGEIGKSSVELRRILQEVAGRGSAVKKDLDQAKGELKEYLTPTADADTRTDVFGKIVELQSLVDWAQHRHATRGIKDQIEAARRELRATITEQQELDQHFDERIAEARESFENTPAPPGAAGIDERWNVELQKWLEAKAEQRQLLSDRRQIVDTTLRELEPLRDNLFDLFQTRRDTIVLLQRSNLFLRSESQITLEAATDGVRDLAKLPRFTLDTAAQAVAYFTNPSHFRSIGTCGVLIVLAGGILILLERAFSRRIGGMLGADAMAVTERKSLPALRLGRAAFRAVSIYVLFRAPAEVLGDLPAGVEYLLSDLALTFSLLWFFRRVARELFRAPVRILPIPRSDATRLYVVSIFILTLSLAYWPIFLALDYLGYENQGAIDALSMAYRVLVGLTVLTVLARRSVFMKLLPESKTRVGGALRFLVALLHPIVVLLVPGLLILYALQYEILAGLITSGSVVLLLVALFGFLLHQGGTFLLARALRLGIDDPEESEESRRQRRVAHEQGRFVLTLAVLLISFWAIVFFNGYTVRDVWYFFDVPLPMQDTTETPVTYWNLCLAIFVLVLTLSFAKHLKETLHELILPRTGLDVGLQYTITTLAGYIVVALGLTLAASQVFELEKLGYVIAALSIGIGFGLQEIISNFISGLILLFERPLKVGDQIDVGGTEGIVRRIQIRSTTVQTKDNVWILVPNKDFITQNVTNHVYTDAKQRIHVRVGVAYGSDTSLVRKVLLEVAKDNGQVLKRPAPEVWFEDFGDSSLNFDLLIWINDPREHNRISSHLRFAIDAAFRRYGVEIPFPQRDLHLRSSNVALHSAGREESEVEAAVESTEPPEE